MICVSRKNTRIHWYIFIEILLSFIFIDRAGILVSVNESRVDVKASEKLAELHDELRVYNDFSNPSELRNLNIFIARLFFCFFAEDTSAFAHD